MNDPLRSAAVVTGASRGIGREIALALSKRGLHVLLTYASRTEEAEAVVRMIRGEGGDAEAYRLNVADSGAVAGFFRDAVKNRVRLDVLVNNAGITKDGMLLRMKDEDFDAVLDVNLKGAFYCLRSAAAIMASQRYGRIVNIASVVGQSGNAGQINYAAAKAGLIAMTKSAAKELGSRGITVNAVAPGFIETDMTAALADDVKAAYSQNIPLKRFGTTRDVAEAVAFLASPESGYITGQVLAVNGGLYC